MLSTFPKGRSKMFLSKINLLTLYNTFTLVLNCYEMSVTRICYHNNR
jgi:hypothetical protein